VQKPNAAEPSMAGKRKATSTRAAGSSRARAMELQQDCARESLMWPVRPMRLFSTSPMQAPKPGESHSIGKDTIMTFIEKFRPTYNFTGSHEARYNTAVRPALEFHVKPIAVSAVA
jgi:hypothetical protein